MKATPPKAMLRNVAFGRNIAFMGATPEYIIEYKSIIPPAGKLEWSKYVVLLPVRDEENMAMKRKSYKKPVKNKRGNIK